MTLRIAVGITVLLVASTLVMGSAGASGPPSGGVIEVTGYNHLAVARVLGSVTVEATGTKAKTIRAALSGLPTFTGPFCVDDPITFTIRLDRHPGGAPTYTATGIGCPTPGVVYIRNGSSRPTWMKEDCALKRAVLAVLPAGRAKGTRHILAIALHEEGCD